MDCKTAQVLLYLSRYRTSSSELSTEDRISLEQHLTLCSTCRDTAHRESRFDETVRVAMSQTPTPQGLRIRIVQKITRYRKLQRRRRVGRYALVAVILAMLGITGHGLYRAAQPSLNLEVLARDLDRMVERPDQALSEWLSEQRLPPELPLPFDFRQYVFHGYQRIAGRNVPVIVFQRWRGSSTTPEVLKLYIVKSSDFHLDSLLATSGSFYTARVITHEAEDQGVIYLALSTTAELTPFLLQALTPAAS